MRWQHPEHGLMPPAEFIELAEVSGIIQPLTRWVIDHRDPPDLVDWQRHGLELAVAVNLSVRNLYDRELVPWLGERARRSSGSTPVAAQLEITESELMDDPLLAMEVLGKLKALGVATSIDDFGTGYSSLAYLKNLPIDELKIDRSFVGNMVTTRATSRSCARPSTSATTSGSSWWPRASRTPRRCTCWPSSAATGPRATSSVDRCRPLISRRGGATKADSQRACSAGIAWATPAERPAPLSVRPSRRQAPSSGRQSESTRMASAASGIEVPAATQRTPDAVGRLGARP